MPDILPRETIQALLLGSPKNKKFKEMGLENVLQKTALLFSHSGVAVQQAGFCSDLLPRDGAVLHLPPQGCPMAKQDMARLRA